MKKHRKERGWFYALQIFSISFLAILLLAVNPIMQFSPGNEAIGNTLGGIFVTILVLVILCVIAFFYLVRIATRN